ncbi:GPW/gp25 family protein [Candidatus Arsenophonus nilaparvatae]|uniref:type VI secretion system baseplate subunit TssE n=1 Tax=Candidatus Arsenophonus nilaparvatae TaxID=1247023 RepID=UPI0005098F88|nr:GPW/gp25 family protein [Candidatus Arsenophonus nilaparvatae]
MQAQAIPSFLYRLHDDFPHEEEFEIKNNQRQAAIDSLVSDLNMLFSSRPLSGSLEVYDELERSILNYGVIDVVDVDILNDDRIELLRKNIYQSLVLFEPRLQDITVKLQNNSPENIVFWVQGLFWGQRIVFSVTWSSVAYSYSIFWGE